MINSGISFQHDGVAFPICC